MTEMSKIDAKSMLADVTEFIWAESAMLDLKEYDDWLDLWVAEGLYIMPIGDTVDYKNAVNLCYDNDKMRRDRIGRFHQGFSISSAPPAQTVRTLSRFRIEAAEGDLVTVSCAEHLVEDKFGRQRIWAGNVEYILKITDAGFKLQQKVIRLLNSDGMLNSFSYLF
ncbi:aromatic-ring-hydroxylating dioxygenase subunit beta [Celeribacter neptunius]|uniref:3-phenylpropionate/cinnamic acid dioxygenase, small subunit n=1 Tax=Celeribacter neptunius TaxID=588602 RepID=A0A1I3NL99_9RHOB|nr:aromatic-ring-hydroxylating dioxygenase subunit beta [Celeribacter neptunius]SFJ09955.1 3-phenylpropionate/cinnamic acid dioxygenase, small subunit [Celeribacter neptunius]